MFFKANYWITFFLKGVWRNDFPEKAWRNQKTESFVSWMVLKLQYKAWTLRSFSLILCSNDSTQNAHSTETVRRVIVNGKPSLAICGDWALFLSSAGRPYFFNLRTLVNQWEKPAEWIDSVPLHFAAVDTQQTGDDNWTNTKGFSSESSMSMSSCSFFSSTINNTSTERFKKANRQIEWQQQREIRLF